METHYNCMLVKMKIRMWVRELRFLGDRGWRLGICGFWEIVDEIGILKMGKMKF